MHPETSLKHFTPYLTVIAKNVREKEIADCKLIIEKQ
jgi:hypothetical protein